jgi:hypothetical protein
MSGFFEPSTWSHAKQAALHTGERGIDDRIGAGYVELELGDDPAPGGTDTPLVVGAGVGVICGSWGVCAGFGASVSAVCFEAF